MQTLGYDNGHHLTFVSDDELIVAGVGGVAHLDAATNHDTLSQTLRDILDEAFARASAAVKAGGAAATADAEEVVCGYRILVTCDKHANATVTLVETESSHRPHVSIVMEAPDLKSALRR